MNKKNVIEGYDIDVLFVPILLNVGEDDRGKSGPYWSMDLGHTSYIHEKLDQIIATIREREAFNLTEVPRRFYQYIQKKRGKPPSYEINVIINFLGIENSIDSDLNELKSAEHIKKEVNELGINFNVTISENAIDPSLVVERLNEHLKLEEMYSQILETIRAEFDRNLEISGKPPKCTIPNPCDEIRYFADSGSITYPAHTKLTLPLYLQTNDGGRTLYFYTEPEMIIKWMFKELKNGDSDIKLDTEKNVKIRCPLKSYISIKEKGVEESSYCDIWKILRGMPEDDLEVFDRRFRLVSDIEKEPFSDGFVYKAEIYSPESYIKDFRTMLSKLEQAGLDCKSIAY